MNKTIWVEINKTVTKEGQEPVYKGVFAKVSAELKKNTLQGISLKGGSIGFVFGKELQPDLQAEVEKPSVPTSTHDGKNIKPEVASRDGQETVDSDGDKHVVREIEVISSADELSDKIARLSGRTKSEVLNHAFHLGFAQLATDAFELLLKSKVKSGKIPEDKAEALLNISKGFKRDIDSMRVTSEPELSEENMPEEIKNILKMIKDAGAEVTVKQVEVTRNGKPDPKGIAFLKKMLGKE